MNMKTVLLLFTVLTMHAVFCQDTTLVNGCIPFNEYQGFPIQPIIVTTTIQLPACPYTIENALEDIQENRLSIIISGGFQGFPEMDEAKTEKFKQTYNVQFEYIGCLRYYDPEKEDIEGYNETIYQHLDVIYGTKWRSDFTALF